jgi:hypothetical protein
MGIGAELADAHPTSESGCSSRGADGMKDAVSAVVGIVALVHGNGAAGVGRA